VRRFTFNDHHGRRVRKWQRVREWWRLGKWRRVRKPSHFSMRWRGIWI
jgi:hypothetical protein